MWPDAPRALHTEGLRGHLAGAFVLLSLLAGCGEDPPRPASPDTDPTSYAEQLTEATNDARTAEGLDELTRSACLEEAARERAAALVGEALAHEPLGGVVDECAPGSRAAENLVNSGARPDAVVDAWMDSSGHRNNIVDPRLREIGVGCVTGPDGYVCAQLFLGEE